MIFRACTPRGELASRRSRAPTMASRNCVNTADECLRVRIGNASSREWTNHRYNSIVWKTGNANREPPSHGLNDHLQD